MCARLISPPGTLILRFCTCEVTLTRCAVTFFDIMPRSVLACLLACLRCAAQSTEFVRLVRYFAYLHSLACGREFAVPFTASRLILQIEPCHRLSLYPLELIPSIPGARRGVIKTHGPRQDDEYGREGEGGRNTKRAERREEVSPRSLSLSFPATLAGEIYSRVCPFSRAPIWIRDEHGRGGNSEGESEREREKRRAEDTHGKERRGCSRVERPRRRI